MAGSPVVAHPRIEFVSISVGESAHDVDAFRRETSSMPWTHALVGPEGLRPVQELSGGSAIPAWMLVGPDGIMLAVGGSLRGDAELMPALERALAKP